MLCMLVTAAVLNNGMVVNAKQLLNMLVILVTAAVLSSGMLVREEQL